MTDASLRDLERRFRASGNVEDEAAWLRARVQAGDLEESKLELAAFLGAPGALAASASPSVLEPDFTTDVQDRQTMLYVGLSAWIRALCTFHLEAGVRAALACSEAVLPEFEALHPECIQPSAVLERIRDWLHGQDPALAQQAAREGLEAEQAVADATLYVPPSSEHEIGFAPTYCALVLADDATRQAHGSGVFTDAASAVCHSASVVASHVSPGRVATLIAQALVPWALGYSDPVRDRVERRQREVAGE